MNNALKKLWNVVVVGGVTLAILLLVRTGATWSLEKTFECLLLGQCPWAQQNSRQEPTTPPLADAMSASYWRGFKDGRQAEMVHSCLRDGRGDCWPID